MSRIKPHSGPRQRLPRVQDKGHLKWIRTLPCLASGRLTGIEAAHVRYGSLFHDKRSTGMAEKPDDRWAVPLHHSMHRTGPRAQHSENERRWWAGQGIDPLAVAKALYEVSGDDAAGLAIIRGRGPITRRRK